MSKFGDRIRELRKAKGYSLRQLAPLVGVGFSYLSKVERGRLDFDGSAGRLFRSQPVRLHFSRHCLFVGPSSRWCQ